MHKFTLTKYMITSFLSEHFSIIKTTTSPEQFLKYNNLNNSNLDDKQPRPLFSRPHVEKRCSV